MWLEDNMKQKFHPRLSGIALIACEESGDDKVIDHTQKRERKNYSSLESHKESF